MKKIFVILLVSVALTSCKTLNNVSCVSRKYVNVVFITKNGNYYSLNVPYCDTVRLSSNEIPDSTQATKVSKKLMSDAKQ